MAAQSTAEIFTDDKSKVNLLMLTVTQEVLESEYETYCRYITSQHGNKQVVLHKVGNLQYCVVVAATQASENDPQRRDDDEEEFGDNSEFSPTESNAALFRQLFLLHDLLCFRIPIVANQNMLARQFTQTEAQMLLHPLVQTMKRMTFTHQSVLVQGIEYVELGTFLRDDVTEAIQKVIRSHRYILHAVLFVGTKLATVASRTRTWILSPRDLLCLLIYTESKFKVVQMEEEQEQQNSEDNQNPADATAAHDIADQLFESIHEMSTSDSVSTHSDNVTDSFHSMDSHATIKTPKPDDQQPPPENEFEETEDEEENGNQTLPDAAFDQVLFRHPVQGLVKCGVFARYFRENNITLLLIYDPSIERQESPTQQREQSDVDTNDYDLQPFKHDLVNVQKHIFKELNNFVSFLKIKAHAHITMMHYLHYCPGIVHFIFVDRIRNRVIAPRIVPLFTSSNKADTGKISVQFLKKKIWEMVHMAQQYRDQGYTEMGIAGLGVQYWFKEWIEDEHGNELKFSEKNIFCENDGLGHARAHFELYTMYLPFVSTQAIAHYNRILTCILLDRQLEKLSSSGSSRGGSFSTV
jgi:hypothetical protein